MIKNTKYKNMLYRPTWHKQIV